MTRVLEGRQFGAANKNPGFITKVYEPIAALRCGFSVKVLFKDWVARIVGVLLKFSTRKDVYVKGIQKYRTDN